MVATALLLTKTNKYSTGNHAAVKAFICQRSLKEWENSPSLKTIVMGIAFHFTAICWTIRIIKTQLWMCQDTSCSVLCERQLMSAKEVSEKVTEVPQLSPYPQPSQYSQHLKTQLSSDLKDTFSMPRWQN